jgi:lipopolysaccharide biosynthesis protein
LKNSKSICLFAHFNARMTVSDYVLYYLEHLASIGFEICFISNSPIKAAYRNLVTSKIKNCRIFERENKGADFGAWKWAIRNNIVPGDVDQILLTNDSLYGPFFPLAPIVEAMQSRSDIDFWGFTESYQGEWHLQSYFLWLSKKVFDSGAFKKVFDQEFEDMDKLQIIEKGELQLSKSLSGAGFKGTAYIPYPAVSPDSEVWSSKNPTHFYWEQLLEKFHFPFIKREVILQNPETVPNTDKIFSLIHRYSSYPVENVKQSISDYIASYDLSPGFPDKLSVICHIYYQESVYYFLTRIIALKSPETQFIFNLSKSLYHNFFFREVLVKFFPDAIIIYTPNQGRDIGGKLAAFDVLMKTGIQTDYTLIIHDKLSPHTAAGIEWRNRLFKIINPEQLDKIFRRFRQNKEVGVICTKELIQNEYDPDRKEFTCTSSQNLLNYIRKYDLKISDYSFTAGTIFWIRTGILYDFFSCHSPLSVRKGFEAGNSLDFDKGTNIHAWERLFSFIAHSQGFKTVGI